MKTSSAQSMAERKALLLARAELDRVRVQLAIHEIGNVLVPPGRDERAAGSRPAAAIIVQVAGQLFGLTRLARWLRIASIVTVAMRVARDWQRGR